MSLSANGKATLRSQATQRTTKCAVSSAAVGRAVRAVCSISVSARSMYCWMHHCHPRPPLYPLSVRLCCRRTVRAGRFLPAQWATNASEQ